MAPSRPEDDSEGVEFLGDVDRFEEAPRESFNLEPIQGPWRFVPAAPRPKIKVITAFLMVGAMMALAVLFH